MPASTCAALPRFAGSMIFIEVAVAGKTFHIITLGCKVNQYESEALREAWLAAGHRELQTPAGADLVLINSCAITAKAVSDLRAAARRARKAAPGCELLITGCAAQALPGELEELPLDALIPQADKVKLLHWPGLNDLSQPDAVEDDAPEALPGNVAELIGAAPGRDFWSHDTPDEDLTGTPSAFPAFSIKDYARTRAVLKIHDGCSQHCTYCIVPQGRGPSVSRPWPETLAEASRLVKAGFKEIVLNGVNLRQYGLDLTPPENFWRLLRRLEAALAPEWGSDEARASGNFLRLRISSLEPGQLDAEALETLAASRLVALQLHLSLQSGSPAVLKRMGRGHYDPSLIAGWLQKLAGHWPMFGLGADFIAGFPGESDEQFEETLTLAAELPFTYAHVFPYSPRPGTAAARLPGQIPQDVKKDRAARLRRLIDAKKQKFLQAQLQLDRVWVALEEERGKGVNEFYSECLFAGEAPPPGKKLTPARPVALDGKTLLVEVLDLTGR